MTAATIRYDNLLLEAQYAFHAGEFGRAADLLTQALALALLERKAQEAAP